MPDKVLEHICWGGTIQGGPFDQHQIEVSASREQRKYSPSVRVMGPGGDFLPANPLEIPSAILRCLKETPRGALDVGFKALYFYLNNEVAAARISEVQEKSKHWTYLDDMGKRDHDFLNKLWEDEQMDEFQAEEYTYDPPQSEAVKEAGLMEIGSSASMTSDDSMDDASSISGQDKGSEENPGEGDPGSESSVDGNVAADEGLQSFLKSNSGLTPELSKTQGVGTGEKG